MAEQKVYTVPNISCDHCARAIHEALEGAEGLEDVQVDVTGKKVSVALRPEADEQEILRRLKEEGYAVSP